MRLCPHGGFGLLDRRLVVLPVENQKAFGSAEQRLSKIAQNDLDFHVESPSSDEMGQLCQSFETMRASLEANSRALWDAVEERKRLNAAFSHDLRTPLTVLQGYS